MIDPQLEVLSAEIQFALKKQEKSISPMRRFEAGKPGKAKENAPRLL